jgi:dipeptidyl aminopeptidase/acylaminoacyl peptidase
MAATAMLTYPDFFKVGISISGLHDPGIYERWWNDMFQGVEPVESQDGEAGWASKRTPTNIEIAGNLKGRLLILAGEIDANVHPSHSARLVDALMAAGKRFDYLVIPGRGHGWSRHWRYELQLIWTYFVEHLLGEKQERIDFFKMPGTPHNN